jgi:Uma2 family endonuclease
MQYERFGVKEYWIVDPVHFMIDQFILENGRYQLQATFGDSDTVPSSNISCISIDLGQLFAEIRR